MEKQDLKTILFVGIILILIIVPRAQSQSDGGLLISNLQNSPTRFVANLNGKWDISYDDENWQTLSVPYSDYFQRQVIYSRNIKISKDILNKFSWHIEFYGIDDQVQVFINNQYAGLYFGGSTPFRIRIPDRMITGSTNNLKLIVSPANSSTRQIKEQSIFANKVFTGVINDILLIGTPKVWVNSLNYRTNVAKDGGYASIKAKVDISTSKLEGYVNRNISDSTGKSTINRRVSVIVDLLDKNSKAVLATSAPRNLIISEERTYTEVFDLVLNNPNLWSIETPNLYIIKAKILVNQDIIDECSRDIGFKRLAVGNSKNGKQFYLNGKEFIFKGIDYYPDFGKHGAYVSPNQLLKDIKQIKTLGANTIRFTNAMPHPLILSFCDKYGLMALIDLPIKDVPAAILNSDEIKVRMKNVASRMIEAYSSYTSVCAFGLMNNVISDKGEIDGFEQGLIDQFKRSADKLIYKSVLVGTNYSNHLQYDFFLTSSKKRIIDFNKLKKELTALQESCGGKPLVINYGLPIEPNNRNGFSDPNSIESQANHIRNMYHLIEDMNLAGSIIWSFNDYLLQNNLMILDNEDNAVATTGIVDRDRKERLSYLTLQALFNDEKEPLLNAGSYSESSPVFFILLGLVLFGLIFFMINRFKRFREYILRSVLRPFNFYADIRDQRIMSNIQTLSLGFIISATMGLFISSILYFYKSSENTQYLIMLILPWAGLRDYLFKMIWMPELLTILLTLVFYSKIFILAFILRLASYFVRGRIYYRDTFTIIIWSAAPILILLPLTIILTRFLIFSPDSIYVFSFAWLALMLWIVFRILRATSVVYDVVSFKVYAIGLIAVIIVVSTVTGFYQYNFSFFAYLDYFLKKIALG